MAPKFSPLPTSESYDNGSEESWPRYEIKHNSGSKVHMFKGRRGLFLAVLHVGLGALLFFVIQKVARQLSQNTLTHNQRLQELLYSSYRFNNFIGF